MFSCCRWRTLLSPGSTVVGRPPPRQVKSRTPPPANFRSVAAVSISEMKPMERTFRQRRLDVAQVSGEARRRRRRKRRSGGWGYGSGIEAIRIHPNRYVPRLPARFKARCPNSSKARCRSMRRLRKPQARAGSCGDVVSPSAAESNTVDTNDTSINKVTVYL